MIIEGPVAQFGRRVSSITNFIARAISASVFELRRGTVEEPGELMFGIDDQGRLECPGKIVVLPSQLSTSGSFKEFGGIPPWVKRINVHLYRVSLTDAANFLIRLQSSAGDKATEYNATSSTAGANIVTSTTGFILRGAANSVMQSGTLVISKVADTNNWVITGLTNRDDSPSFNVATGHVPMGSNIVTGVKVLSSGSDTLDSGVIGITYE